MHTYGTKADKDMHNGLTAQGNHIWKINTVFGRERYEYNFVIGGSGKRLWPLSNDIRSKQFIKLFKTEQSCYESMIQRIL